MPACGAFFSLRSCGHFWGRTDGIISALSSIPFLPFYLTGIDAFKEHYQVASLDFDRLVFSIDKADVRKAEGPDLEAFGEDCPAVEVPPQGLDEVTTPTSKEKQMASIRVLANCALGQLE